MWLRVVKQRQELWENERTVELDFASGRGAIQYTVLYTAWKLVDGFEKLVSKLVARNFSPTNFLVRYFKLDKLNKMLNEYETVVSVNVNGYWRDTVYINPHY